MMIGPHFVAPQESIKNPDVGLHFFVVILVAARTSEFDNDEVELITNYL